MQKGVTGDLMHPVTHTVRPEGSAVSRANKYISTVMTIINERSLSISSPTGDVVFYLM